MERSQGTAFLLAVVMLVSGFSSIGSAVDRNVLKAEVQGILNTIETNYGPLALKERTKGLQWAKTKAEYVSQVDKVQSEKEYYLLLSKLLRELKDAHVSVALPSTFEKEMPMQFTVVEGKTILNWVGEEGIAQCKNAEVGDELLKFDNRTPDQLRAELGEVSTVGNAGTDLIYLTGMFTSRKEAKGQYISYNPDQLTHIELKSHKTGTIVACDMKWKQKGVPIIDRNFKDSPTTVNLGFPMQQNLQINRGDNESVKMDKLLGLFNKMHNLNALEAIGGPFGMKPTPPAPKREKGIAIQEGALDPFFKMPLSFISIEPPGLLKAIFAGIGGNLSAGYMNYKGKRIGILRISSYMPRMIQFANLELRYYIGMLEKSTDMLIIDQTNNPGGAVPYADWVVGALNNGMKQEKHIKFGVKPTQNFMRTFAMLMDQLQTETMIPKQITEKYMPLFKENFDKVYTAYKAGASLSEPINISVISDFLEEVMDTTLWVRMKQAIPGGEKVQKFAIDYLVGVDITKRQTYTKPVTMIINELDFSAGDYTPAILQDYGRVKMIGANTSGAGGSVEEFENRFANHFDFRLTTSLMIRHDGNVVENLGVKPDVPMAVTLQDYVDGFSNYIYRVMDYVIQTPGGIVPNP